MVHYIKIFATHRPCIVLFYDASESKGQTGLVKNAGNPQTGISSLTLGIKSVLRYIWRGGHTMYLHTYFPFIYETLTPTCTIEQLYVTTDILDDAISRYSESQSKFQACQCKNPVRWGQGNGQQRSNDAKQEFTSKQTFPWQISLGLSNPKGVWVIFIIENSFHSCVFLLACKTIGRSLESNLCIFIVYL